MVGFTTLHGVWPVAVGSALIGIGSGLLSPVFIVFFTEQVAESVRGRVLGLFNALALIASPLGLAAIAIALSVTTLEVAAYGLLAVWVLVSVYAFVSKGMRIFAADPVPPTATSSATAVATTLDLTCRQSVIALLTISQLAAYVGVTVRTVRHYHRLGLLPEPERDHSGYRRYGADDVIMLKRVSTLARSGVPLAGSPTCSRPTRTRSRGRSRRSPSICDNQIAELRQRRAGSGPAPVR